LLLTKKIRKKQIADKTGDRYPTNVIFYLLSNLKYRVECQLNILAKRTDGKFQYLTVATIATGLASATLLSASHIDLNTAFGLWFLGSCIGLLPDIDSDHSISLASLFNLFSLIIVLIVLRYITGKYFVESKLSQLIAIPLLIYATIKYVIRVLFEKITVHLIFRTCFKNKFPCIFLPNSQL